ncbi:glycosyltransferase family 2 protein [Silanimonas sp.]|jgi:glycosyltransferase involved in cell wall biosynthesis|uniref:glycosyltransferase family 2 protein n=1 Tax=Silanimonas sp. TaxID=1929290 RepID=UPI0022C74AE9|nr:glycosyltransferase family 2 protein [Silanimonas sp.]MCZ8062016.1 glycosyltransferase family 2 protein [Silanimonas sp.]
MVVSASPRVAVVIPSYRVTRHVLGVIERIGPEVERIYVVDDACPDGSGEHVAKHGTDPRVRVIRQTENGGVGAAVVTGYRAAIEEGMDIVVKIDGDGQMDPALLPSFIDPILRGEADYAKGNRFWDLRHIRRMPRVRRWGNLGLSFMAKASTGYWDLFDPTNGYTALSVPVAALLPLDSLSRRYFFETDLLFRLGTLRAAVVDVPMDAFYGDETSHLDVRRAVFEFGAKHLRNFGKRVSYNYFLRDLSIASLELVAAVLLIAFALAFGGYHWLLSIQSGTPATVGTVMLPALAMVSGLQFLLAFLAYDIGTMPRRALHPLLSASRRRLETRR